MHVDVDAVLLRGRDLRPQDVVDHWLLPALRVTEEDLYEVGPPLGGAHGHVIGLEVGPDPQHGPSLRAGRVL